MNFFKFAISVRDGHCNCSPRASKSLATTLLASQRVCGIMTLNFIPAWPMNSRTSEALYKKMGTIHSCVTHTEFWWLSCGQLLARSLELKDEVVFFCHPPFSQSKLPARSFLASDFGLYGGHFKKVLKLSILHLNWFTNFCNISIYPSFVTHLPDDGHMSGRNMKEVYYILYSWSRL